MFRVSIITSIAMLAVLAYVPYAEAQSHGGVLILDPIPQRVVPGDTVTFSGKIYTTSGYAVQNAAVYIKDNVDFGIDTVIGIAYTDDDGRFSTAWTAQSRSSGSWDFYAVFEGSYDIYEMQSQTYSVMVETQAVQATYQTQAYVPDSSIRLDTLPHQIYAGQQIIFTGILLSGGQPAAGAYIRIMEDDPLVPDQQLASGRTDMDGRFSIPWTAKAGLVEIDFDIYAISSSARSYNQEMSVLKYGGSLQMDPIPSSARVNDVITFSGTLTLDRYDPTGAVVYIKDEDTANPDDLLAAAYVDANGRFSAGWRVSHVDPTNTAEIYAVFEGNNLLYRQTTCDSGGTMPLGGLCINTIPLRIVESAPLKPERPASGEYMDLLYALDFDKEPHVAIVPSPDSYSRISGHIVPAQEGVMMWTQELEYKYGGNWDVTFEVVSPGSFFKSKPDVIMKLVTPDQDSNCDDVYAGVAYPTIIRPVQTSVCSASEGRLHSNAEVSATAAHEFIHAMGLGHTFNKAGDLMCSNEDGIPTCSLGIRSYMPSDLNLDAVAAIYRTDGFIKPNNLFSPYEKFYGNTESSPIPRNYVYEQEPEPHYPSRNDPVYIPELDPHYPVNKPDVREHEFRTDCQITHTSDIDVDEPDLPPGWYAWLVVCDDYTVNYWFQTDSWDGFELHVLPPETNVEHYIDYAEGYYYTCEDPENVWHKRSGSCSVEAGSSIVLYNPGDGDVSITGYIWTD